MPNRRDCSLGGKLPVRKGMWLKRLKKGIVRCLVVLGRKTEEKQKKNGLWVVITLKTGGADKCSGAVQKVSEKTLAFGKKIRMILAGISLNACECIVPYAVKGGDTDHSCACQEDGTKNHMN